MKRILVLLVLLLLLAVIFHGFPCNIKTQEAKNGGQGEAVMEFPPDKIIKNILVGPIRRSVLTRKNQGIEDIEILYKELIVVFELFHRDSYDEKQVKYWYKLPAGTWRNYWITGA